nr:DUF1707 domain-containing protein [Rhodococcus sp. HNM0563]
MHGLQSTCGPSASGRGVCSVLYTADPFRTNYASAVIRRRSPQTRVRDSDRLRARTRLDAAYDEGQLTAEQRRDLVARTETATTLPELADLVRDLEPPVESEGDGAERPPGD